MTMWTWVYGCVCSIPMPPYLCDFRLSHAYYYVYVASLGLCAVFVPTEVTFGMTAFQIIDSSGPDLLVLVSSLEPCPERQIVGWNGQMFVVAVPPSVSLSAFSIPLVILGVFILRWTNFVFICLTWQTNRLITKISLFRIRFSFLRKSEIRSTCLFFFSCSLSLMPDISLVLLCVAILRQTVWRERGSVCWEKNILYCFWWAASQLWHGSSLREGDEWKGRVGDCQRYNLFQSFFCPIKKDFDEKNECIFAQIRYLESVLVSGFNLFLVLGPLIFSKKPQFNILSWCRQFAKMKWNRTKSRRRIQAQALKNKKYIQFIFPILMIINCGSWDRS